MRAMKDSGTEWIGEVPKEWEITLVKREFSIVLGATPSSTNLAFWDDSDKGIAWITPADFSNGATIEKGKRNISELGFASCNTTLVPSGSIVMSTRAPIGKIAYAKSTLCTNQGCKSLVSKSNEMTSHYAFYVMLAANEELLLRGRGTTFAELSGNALANIKIPRPPLPEQHRIADYLDAKCTEIDSAITSAECAIKDFKAYKSSVIFEAVTKGLDENAPMKSSGIEWIGEVPSEWKIVPIKYLCSCNDESLKESTPPDYFFDYVDISSVTEGKINTVERHCFRNAPSRARRIVKSGDVLISTVRTYLKAIVKIDDKHKDCIVSTGFAVLRPVQNVDSSFFSYALQNDGFAQKVSAESRGISYPAINTTNLMQIPIPVPPLPEQHRIADYLDAKCTQIDRAISAKQSIISELKAYKKSLIFEVVTGKCEV